MVRCVSEVYHQLQDSPPDSVLLGVNDTVVCVLQSHDAVELATQFLPSGITVLGVKSEEEIEHTPDIIATARVRGTIPMLVVKETQSYLPRSVEHARQVLESCVLLSSSSVSSLDDPLSASSYQLAVDLSAEVGEAPMILYEEECYQSKLQLDLVLLPNTSPRELLFQQLNALVLDVKGRAHHFQPPGLGVPLTVLQSHDPVLVGQLHHTFNLPNLDYFNQEQAIRLEKADSEGRLISPHREVAGVRAYDVYTVTGDYAYHHYMQDKFNDNGWGCAYRSLQTLCSWFLYNGYTNRSPPSHTQIQQALVDMGDKGDKFVGSRQWIGSVEVGMVLDAWIGGDTSHRIQFVSCGEDMGMQGGVLSHHFKTQGTPVMIGGGVLAHTILGVKYDSVTGDTQFLILDPHYTGQDNIGTVLKEGQCAWKGPNFWNKTAHYNMCLPQRPIRNQIS